MSLPAYPNYRQTRHEWLGKIPVHWNVTRLKYLGEAIIGLTYDPSQIVAEGNGTLVLRSSNVQDGMIVFDDNVFVETNVPDELITKIGDILICSRNGSRALIGKNATIDERSAGLTFGAFMTIFRTSMSNYVAWLLNSPLFDFQSGQFLTSTINQLTVGVLKNFEVPLPSSSEQIAISTFLDRETGKIDALVAEQERLMALLKEKRQAIISQAVTKGLDPNVPMKDSGVAWIGRIPSHWKTSPLKWLTDPDRPIMYGIVLPGPDVGEGVPILKGGNVKPSRMNLDAMARTTPEIEAPFARARLQSGDLVYAIRGTIGDCERVPAELEGSNITQDVARVAIARGVCSAWARWALLSSAIREELACGSLGAAVRGVNIFDLKRVRIPLPPRKEQLAIATFIDQEIDKLDGLTDEAATAVALLNERRAALISAAVTGKIDVRGIVPEAREAA